MPTFTPTLLGPLVDEVLDFATHGALLSGAIPAQPTWIRIDDYEVAQEIAWGRHELNRRNPQFWSDFRSNASAKVMDATYYRTPAATQSALDDWFDPMAKVLRQRLRGPYAELLDDISADLHLVMVNRAVHGATGFFEELFSAYRAGGWPCGWRGRNSGGSLVVFMPDPQRAQADG